MRPSTVVVETPRFRVRSHFNGLAYVLEHRGLGKDILFQDDDAEVFRRSLNSLTEGNEGRLALDYDDALDILWQEYAELGEPVQKPVFTHPRDALDWHTSGAVERGEAEPIVEVRAPIPMDLRPVIHLNADDL